MTWTNQPPTEPGWYWWDRPGFGVEVARVVTLRDGRIAVEPHTPGDLDPPWLTDPYQYRGHWAGPIAAPADPLPPAPFPEEGE